jgi:hypothetical protein
MEYLACQEQIKTALIGFVFRILPSLVKRITNTSVLGVFSILSAVKLLK